eukprot:GHVQ01013163.1.p1 GENE.GHVQ01013163.1~~GHVQ01013163.1.p1  ORF type:complete len:578 (+),score=114.12 GHVQ01013163.1:388-2121(+)
MTLAGCTSSSHDTVLTGTPPPMDTTPYVRVSHHPSLTPRETSIITPAAPAAHETIRSHVNECLPPTPTLKEQQTVTTTPVAAAPLPPPPRSFLRLTRAARHKTGTAGKGGVLGSIGTEKGIRGGGGEGSRLSTAKPVGVEKAVKERGVEKAVKERGVEQAVKECGVEVIKADRACSISDCEGIKETDPGGKVPVDDQQDMSLEGDSAEQENVGSANTNTSSVISAVDECLSIAAHISTVPQPYPCAVSEALTSLAANRPPESDSSQDTRMGDDTPMDGVCSPRAKTSQMIDHQDPTHSPPTVSSHSGEPMSAKLPTHLLQLAPTTEETLSRCSPLSIPTSSGHVGLTDVAPISAQDRRRLRAMSPLPRPSRFNSPFLNRKSLSPIVLNRDRQSINTQQQSTENVFDGSSSSSSSCNDSNRVTPLPPAHNSAAAESAPPVILRRGGRVPKMTVVSNAASDALCRTRRGGRRCESAPGPVVVGGKSLWCPQQQYSSGGRRGTPASVRQRRGGKGIARKPVRGPLSPLMPTDRKERNKMISEMSRNAVGIPSPIRRKVQVPLHLRIKRKDRQSTVVGNVG